VGGGKFGIRQEYSQMAEHPIREIADVICPHGKRSYLHLRGTAAPVDPERQEQNGVRVEQAA